MHTPKVSLIPSAKKGVPKITDPNQDGEEGRFIEISRVLIIAAVAVGVLVAMLFWLA